GQLDDRCPPDQAGPGAAVEVLHRGGRGEEDRADEEHRRVGGRADELKKARERPDGEAGRADDEQHPAPPRLAAVPWGCRIGHRSDRTRSPPAWTHPARVSASTASSTVWKIRSSPSSSSTPARRAIRTTCVWTS